MDTILSSLHNFLQSEDDFDKILIVPYQSMGTRLLECCAAQYGGVLGLRVYTPDTLAMEICAQHGCAPSVLDETAAALLALSVLEGAIQDQGDPLTYFSGLNQKCLTLSTARELLRCFHLADQFGVDCLSSQGVPAPRLRDLERLHMDYRRAKQERGLWDRFDLFRLACQLLDGHSLPVPVAICSNVAAQGIVRTFLEQAVGDGAVIPVPAAEAVPDIPALFLPQSERPIHAQLHFIRGYGQSNEALSPFYDLLRRQIPFGRAAILYTDASCLPLLRDHAVRLGIPVTFEDGLPLHSGPLLPLLEQLIQWYQDDCPVEGLAGLISGGLVPPHSSSMLKFLRKRNVSFGLEHYHVQFRQAMETLSAPPLPPDAQPNPQDQALYAQLEGWQAFFGRIEALWNDSTDVETGLSLLRGLLLEHYVKPQPETRASEYAALTAAADRLLPVWQGGTFRPFFTVLLDTAAQASWQASSPRDGSIHIAPLSKGAFLDRPYTYILGLGRDSLTAPGRESPLLRDEECRALGLPASDEGADMPLAQLLQILAAARGEVTLSYPCFDTHKMLALPPAPVYEKLRGGQPAALFGYQRSTGFTPADRWLSAGTRPSCLTVPACPPEDLSEFLRDFRFSASSMEIALECPMRFYLQYVLSIPQPERPVLSDRQWLPPNILGNLVHEILERYFHLYIQGNPAPDLPAICQEALAQYQERFPCFSPHLIAQDSLKAEGMVHSAVRYFLQHQTGHIPLAAELTFGTQNEPHMIDGTLFAPPEDFILNLDGYPLHFTGTVDRLDRLPSGHLAILDYKTGSSVRFLQGWDHKIQYYLYSLAMEQIFNQPVDEAVYLLLTQDGVRPVPVSAPAQSAECLVRLKILLNVLSNEQAITMTQPTWLQGQPFCDDGEERQRRLARCAGFCPYAGICKEVRL